MRLPGSLFNHMNNVLHRKQKLLPGGQWKFHSSSFVIKPIFLSPHERINRRKALCKGKKDNLNDLFLNSHQTFTTPA